MADIPKLISTLKEIPSIGKVIDLPLTKENILLLDFSISNKEIENVDLKDTCSFNAYVFDLMFQKTKKAGYGGYGENRIIYKRSGHFQGEEPRSIHLGVDLWVKALSNVYTPFDASIHSFANNEGLGNYGPTIILQHNVMGLLFYTLHGHLSVKSLSGLKNGDTFKQGEKIGEIGDFPENGDWPPHLHFQIITDMLGLKGDFPGVAKPSEKERYLGICPDPNIILRIET